MSIIGGRNIKREFIYSGNSRGLPQRLKPSSFSSRKEGEMVKVVFNCHIFQKVNSYSLLAQLFGDSL